jgi:hypothetical protein
VLLHEGWRSRNRLLNGPRCGCGRHWHRIGLFDRLRLQKGRDIAREKCLERHRRRDIHRVVGDDLLERGERLRSRRERTASIELERARQPVAKRRGERLLFAHRRSLAGVVQQRRQFVRVLIGL